MFDHVKGEIICAAKAPNRQRQQRRVLQCGRVRNQQRRGEQAEQHEQAALGLDPKGIGEVFHAYRFRMASAARRLAPGLPSVETTWASRFLTLTRRFWSCSSCNAAWAIFQPMASC